MNEKIIDLLNLTADLLEINDENQFKADSYRRAGFNLEKFEKDLSSMNEEKIAKIDGIGKSIAKSIYEIVESGTFQELEKLRLQTPEGVVEMLSINGIGPKKIKVIWKELNIISKTELLAACQNNIVAQAKGFGFKTQTTIQTNIIYELEQKGKLRLDQGLELSKEIIKELLQIWPNIEPAGSLESKAEVFAELTFIVATENVIEEAHKITNNVNFVQDFKISSPFVWKGTYKNNTIAVHIHFCSHENQVAEKYILSASEKHLQYQLEGGSTVLKYIKSKTFESTEAIFESINYQFIPTEIREGYNEWSLAQTHSLPKLIEYTDLKGPLHNHSNYSDGKNTLAEIATFCKAQGWEYIGISDHSQSAAYAGGLQPERVFEQFKEIDALNKTFDNFKIFKGIESDILTDGSLDYTSDILSQFDYIVASIHSGLNMDEDKATQRLITAIENPYTKILGHPTGRLLLKRQGYKINTSAIIDACAANNVAIEINANPWRLDLSWVFVKEAIDKGVKIAICPDAHENDGFFDMNYGTLMGRKGFLTKENCINCLSTEELSSWFKTK
jgi:DNA polymerase (family X)